MLGDLLLEERDLALKAHVPGEVRCLYVDPQLIIAEALALPVRLRRSSGTYFWMGISLRGIGIVAILGP